MRGSLRILLGYLLVFSVSVAPLYPAQTAAVGVVLDADGTHLKSNLVTPGASIYPGEVLQTSSTGHVMIQVGQTRFELLKDTSAAFYPSAEGGVAELRHGTIIASLGVTTEHFEIYASDVRIVPHEGRPVLVQVTYESACRVLVTSQHDKVDVTSGIETRAIEEAKSYHVTPEVTVGEYGENGISPLDTDYHRHHSHKACAAAPLQSRTKMPVMAGRSHFLLVSAVTIGTISGVVIHEALESPDRP
jgi:hypothetical protein